MRRGYVVAAFLLLGIVGAGNSSAREAGPQTAAPASGSKSSANAEIAGDNIGDEPDEPVARTRVAATPAESTAAAWQMLDAAMKSSKPQMRIDAVSAVEVLPGYPETQKMVRMGLTDGDRDVRLAAVVATGSMRDRKLLPDLRKALDDKAPAVSYGAAAALWKMHDPSGQDILFSVLGGGRKVNEGFVGEEMHQANKDLHSPSTLALIGAEQAASALLGPFSLGIDVARMMRKGPSPSSARVVTANMLAEDHSNATKQRLISVLHDKDYFVRGAAARGLGNFRGKDVTSALLPLFEDRKLAVRLVAAAAYIRASGVKKKSGVPSSKH